MENGKSSASFLPTPSSTPGSNHFLTFLAVSSMSLKLQQWISTLVLLHPVPSFLSILISCCQEEGYPKASGSQTASLPGMLQWVDACFQQAAIKGL